MRPPKMSLGEKELMVSALNEAWRMLLPPPSPSTEKVTVVVFDKKRLTTEANPV